MPQRSVSVIAGNDATASWANNVVADLAEIYSGGPGVPIGGVIMWWSDNTVPLNYKVCDGTNVSDGASPLNGLSSPNAVNRMVRGWPQSNIRSATPSGGADTHTLSFSEMPQHNHPINDPGHAHGVFDPGHRHSTNGMNDSTGNDGNQRGIRWAHLFENGGTNAINGSGTGIGIFGSGTGITTGLQGDGQPHNNIPAYVGLMFIMRIK